MRRMRREEMGRSLYLSCCLEREDSDQTCLTCLVRVVPCRLKEDGSL